MLALSAPARAASLQLVGQSTWGTAGLPAYVNMYIYVPDRLAARPPILVASHHCQGTGPGTFNETKSSLVPFADTNGLIMIFPEATGHNCWDVGSTKSLTHDGGGDTHAIAQMVRYTTAKYGADSSRVYAFGGSSGAMMTQALMGVYPDMFQAGVAVSGVPCGCWAVGYSGDTGSAPQWSGPCAGGNVIKTGAEWGNLVRATYPGYAGPRPRVQLWHGTADTTISFKNQGEAVKEWTTVLGLNETPSSTDTNKPGYTHRLWKDACGDVALEAWDAQGVGHGVNWDAGIVAGFLGLDNPNSDPSTGACGTGGSNGSGGSPGSGGFTASGGFTSAGGLSGSGGFTSGAGGDGTASGGTANGNGGQTSSSGGVMGSAVGGVQNIGGATIQTPNDSASSENSGCSCRTAGAASENSISGGAALVGLLGVFARRRGRSKSRSASRSSPMPRMFILALVLAILPACDGSNDQAESPDYGGAGFGGNGGFSTNGGQPGVGGGSAGGTVTGAGGFNSTGRGGVVGAGGSAAMGGNGGTIDNSGGATGGAGAGTGGTPPTCPSTFTNPSIWEDLADLEVIRVGTTYYYTASTMHYSPGAPILRSSDLVNWEYIGHSVPVLDYDPRYDLSGGRSYVNGIWASSLRYRESNKTFYWIGCMHNVGGGYVYTATAPEGPWTKHRSQGCYYDVGLLIDDDDKMYTASGNTTISVAELSADGFNQVRTQQVFTTPSNLSGPLEGSRFYKIKGNYYILPTQYANGEYVLKSTSGPFGPYELRPFAVQIPASVPGAGHPHQGGIVETQNGDWYYMGFIDAYPGGRVPVLAPITWSTDGWPSVVLDNGAWAASYPFPNLPCGAGVKPLTGTDTFAGPTPGPEWEWNHNPDNAKWSAAGHLTLQAATVTSDLYAARNTLTHRILGPSSTATIELDYGGMRDGDVAGLALLRDSSAWIGVKRASGAYRVAMVNNLKMDANWNTTSTGTEVAGGNVSGGKIWLRVAADIRPGANRQGRFSYSTDGANFTELGSAFTLNNAWQFFMGYRFAIFNYATQSLGGSVDVASFQLTTP